MIKYKHFPLGTIDTTSFMNFHEPNRTVPHYLPPELLLAAGAYLINVVINIKQDNQSATWHFDYLRHPMNILPPPFLCL